MGVRGVCYNLLKTYTCDRKIYTAVNGWESTVENISIRVPQGSFLSPLE